MEQFTTRGEEFDELVRRAAEAGLAGTDVRELADEMRRSVRCAFCERMRLRSEVKPRYRADGGFLYQCRDCGAREWEAL